jgi:HAD superfamily hydrolase (TIGR01509 family)
VTAVRAALFDLGNVVLEVDFDRSLAHWAAHSRLSPDDVRRRFQVDAAYHGHETGALDAQGYFDYLRRHLELAQDATIGEGWNAMLVAEIDETVALLDAIRAKVPCYALSNTNAAHVAAIDRLFPRLLPRFERVFVSHEIGHRKPSPESFRHVLEALSLDGAEVLFFDDLPENCAAAAALGIRAVLVRSPDDVRKALSEHHLI